MDALNPKHFGQFVRAVRKALGLTQEQVALTSGTHRRFVVELERGKPTIQLGKALKVLATLGVRTALTPPPGINLDQPTAQPRKAKRGSAP